MFLELETSEIGMKLLHLTHHDLERDVGIFLIEHVEELHALTASEAPTGNAMRVVFESGAGAVELHVADSGAVELTRVALWPKAGIDSFAHGIRDRDMDDEAAALLKARPNFVLIPNMPDRGVAADYSWLKGSIPDGELQKIQAAATDRPQVAATWAIQGRNLKRMSDAGVMG